MHGERCAIEYDILVEFANLRDRSVRGRDTIVGLDNVTHKVARVVRASAEVHRDYPMNARISKGSK